MDKEIEQFIVQKSQFQTGSGNRYRQGTDGRWDMEAMQGKQG